MKLSFCTVLGLIFVVLKLCGVIMWSWWLVLLPFYIMLLILGVLVGTVALCAVVSWLLA